MEKSSTDLWVAFWIRSTLMKSDWMWMYLKQDGASWSDGWSWIGEKTQCNLQRNRTKSVPARDLFGKTSTQSEGDNGSKRLRANDVVMSRNSRLTFRKVVIYVLLMNLQKLQSYCFLRGQNMTNFRQKQQKDCERLREKEKRKRDAESNSRLWHAFSFFSFFNVLYLLVNYFDNLLLMACFDFSFANFNVCITCNCLTMINKRC